MKNTKNYINTLASLITLIGLTFTAAASTIVEPTGITSSSHHSSGFVPAHLLDAAVTEEDIGVTSSFGSQFAFLGNNATNDLWLDFGSTQKHFDSILYSGRTPSSASNAENFKTMAFYYSDTDLNGIDLGTLVADETIVVTFAGDDNSVLEAFALSGTHSGRYVGIRTTGGGKNPGGRELRFTVAESSPEPFVITGIEYDAAADTVTLTWRKTGAASYIAKLSYDLSNWAEVLDNSVTVSLDERPEDDEHLTVTFPLEGDRANAKDLFFRIEEG